MDGLDRGAGDLSVGDLSVAVRTSRGLQRHWLFATLLILGAALRVVVLVAYHPALIFPDSVRYLQYARNFTAGQWSADALRQSGYSVLIIPVMLLHDLWIIPLAQHLVGLATAVLVYAVLVRFGIRTWLAAVASIPVLFDPLQLVLEQYVLADVWTVFLVVAALVILVWRRAKQPEDQEEKRGWLPAAACGLLLGLAVTFRDEMLIMIVPAALYVLVAVRPRRRLHTRLAALTGCFLIPVIGYLGWFDASHGEWNFTTFSGAFLYGRVADFASCQGLNLPAYEKPLCPTQPAALRNADFYEWNPQSPQWTFHPPAGMSRDTVVRDFSRAAGLLFTASAVLVLILLAASATFDWRYQLPQLSLIPVAAVLGLTAIGRRPALADGDNRPRPLAVRLGPVGRAGAAGARRGRLPPGAALH